MTKQNSMLVISMIDGLTHNGLHNKGDIFPLTGRLYEELKNISDEQWDEEMLSRFKRVIFRRPTVEQLMERMKEINLNPQDLSDPKQKLAVIEEIEKDLEKKLEDARKLKEEAEEEMEADDDNGEK